MLNEKQKQAYDLIVGAGRGARVSVMGYAGTGKTYTVGQALAELVRRRSCVAVITPTHKALAAARAAGPSRGVHYATIASAIGRRMQRDPQTGELAGRLHGGSIPWPMLDVVIIDEASMATSEDYVLICARAQCAVIAVGDPGQLPPVEGEGIPWPADAVVLDSPVRQSASSPIYAASLAIRSAMASDRRIRIEDLIAHAGDAISVGAGSVGELVRDARDNGLDCRAVSWTNAAVARHGAVIDGEGFAIGQRVYFAQYFRQGDTSVGASTEAEILEVAPPQREDIPIATTTLRVLTADGERVSVGASCNYRARAIMVSTLKRRLAAAEPLARLQIIGMLDQIDSHAVDIRSASSLTAHRAQGSSYDAVVIDWDDMAKNKNHQEFNRLIYVALTRARHFAVIVTALT